MPVIRERLGSTSVGPVGVRAVNTGGVEKYSSIGRAANQIVQASVKEMGVQAVKEGEQLAFQADSKSIININPLTGKPEALNQLNRVVDARMKIKMEDSPMRSFDSVIDFVLNYSEKEHAEQLFNLKLKVFDKDIVKDHNGNEDKKKIRQAKTPLEVLLAYKDIVQKQN